MPFLKQELEVPDQWVHVYSGNPGISPVFTTSLLESNNEARKGEETEDGFGSSIQVGVYIYSIGAGKDKRNTNRYDARTDSWMKLSAMKEGRCDPCVVSYRLSNIYVIGGLIETENPSHCGSVQRYDISTDR